ncbi:hypothetical protein BC831DRAFT_445185 [Entophlyctis helioformis]|nr:hypothetical protein BC831DRAFT_445185 [Entophlyctis helioformis]
MGGQRRRRSRLSSGRGAVQGAIRTVVDAAKNRLIRDKMSRKRIGEIDQSATRCQGSGSETRCGRRARCLSRSEGARQQRERDGGRRAQREGR